MPLSAVFPEPGWTNSRRLRRRARERTVVLFAHALLICVFTWEELGRPSSCPERYRGKPTGPQKRTIRDLARVVRESVRAESQTSVSAGSGRRGAEFCTELSRLAETTAYGRGGRLRQPAGVASLMLDPDRVDLPKASAGSFDPMPYLPTEFAETLADPQLLEDDSRAASGPRGAHWAAGAPSRARGTRTHCTDTHELLRRLDAAEMLEAELETCLAEAGYPPEEAAGLFGVSKGGGRQRLVTNRKVRNARERSLGASGKLFPHSTQLCSVLLNARLRLRGSGDDLPDFYHTILTPPGRWPSNQVGPSLTLGEVRDFACVQRLLARRDPDGKLDDSVRLRVLQKTLPMGDVNATDYAEVAHANVLAAGGALDMDALLSYREPMPAGRLLQMLMIDDHNVHYKAQPGEGRGADDELLEKADRAYAAAGLEPKLSKRFRKEKNYDSIGAHVRDGRWVGARREVIGFAVLFTDAIAMNGRRCSGATLATVVSLWTHAAMFRRCALAFFDEVYRELVRMGPDSSEIMRLSRRAMDELLAMANLAPTLGTDLTAGVDRTVLATDACGGAYRGAAGAEGEVSQDVADELWRLRRRKGLAEGAVSGLESAEHAYVRKNLYLDPETLEDARAGRSRDGVPRTKRAAMGDVMDAISFKPTFFFVPPVEHINLSETRTVRCALRRAAKGGARSGRRGRRVLVAVDSEVAAHSLVKGRSSARRLGPLLRSAAVVQLKNQLELGILPVPSEQEPADGPSRRKRVVQREPRPWAEEFVGGKFDKFPLPPDARLPFIVGRVGASSVAPPPSVDEAHDPDLAQKPPLVSDSDTTDEPDEQSSTSRSTAR